LPSLVAKAEVVASARKSAGGGASHDGFRSGAFLELRFLNFRNHVFDGLYLGFGKRIISAQNVGNLLLLLLRKIARACRKHFANAARAVIK
jgi:hypothetical protein